MKLKLLVWILIIGNCATLVAYLQLRKHTSWAQQEPRAFATKPIGGVATPQTHKGNSPAKGSQDDFEPATVGLKDPNASIMALLNNPATVSLALDSFKSLQWKLYGDLFGKLHLTSAQLNQLQTLIAEHDAEIFTANYQAKLAQLPIDTNQLNQINQNFAQQVTAALGETAGTIMADAVNNPFAWRDVTDLEGRLSASDVPSLNLDALGTVLTAIKDNGQIIPTTTDAQAQEAFIQSKVQNNNNVLAATAPILNPEQQAILMQKLNDNIAKINFYWSRLSVPPLSPTK